MKRGVGGRPVYEKELRLELVDSSPLTLLPDRLPSSYEDEAGVAVSSVVSRRRCWRRGLALCCDLRVEMATAEAVADSGLVGTLEEEEEAPVLPLECEEYSCWS